MGRFERHILKTDFPNVKHFWSDITAKFDHKCRPNSGLRQIGRKSSNPLCDNFWHQNCPKWTQKKIRSFHPWSGCRRRIPPVFCLQSFDIDPRVAIRIDFQGSSQRANREISRKATSIFPGSFFISQPHEFRRCWRWRVHSSVRRNFSKLGKEAACKYNSPAVRFKISRSRDTIAPNSHLTRRLATFF